MTTTEGPVAPTVLVVDDDQDICDAVALMLKLQGFTVETARNGREALDWLRGGGRPEVILLDLMMPVMNGWEFHQEQVQHPSLASIPVLVFSGDGNIARKAGSIGVHAFVPKPIDIDALVSAIRSLLPSATA